MQLLACLTLAASCCLAVANSLVLPKAYYVRLSKDSAELTPDTIVAKAAESSVTVQVRHEFYDESIFYGASVVLKDDDVEKIRALPGVENVFPVPLVKFDRPTMPGMNTTKGTFFDKRNEQRAFNKCAGARVDWNSPHAMTGVDKLHAEGIFGDGVRIAILDTGIDYLNPALGGCFGKGCKVEFGYDYVGDEYGVIDYVLRPKPDPRPECYEGFHGTHVAGIVGMEVPSNATKFAGLMGVAPRATLGMYRVIACVNIDGGDDVILAALQRAVDDGADVVSMSFEVFAWTMGRFSPLPAAVAALKAKGIAVIASAGNYGARGMFNIVLPGGSESAVAVASVENSKFPTYPISDSNGAEFRYAALYPFGTGEYPVAWAGNDDNVARSGCSASDYPPPSSLSEPISNYIVAVRRGVECGLDRIQTLATAANYTRVVTYVDPTHNEISMKAYGLPTPMLDSNGFDFPFATTADGNLFEASEKPGSYRLLVRSQAPLLVEQPGGISPNNFSSVGPNTDFRFKPDIAAPGGSILSTYPVLQNGGGFGIISGTSMAAPYVSGVYALIKSRHPSLSVDEIFDLLKVTAKPINMAGVDQLSPTVQQGAGLIQAYDAFHAVSIIKPSSPSLVQRREAQILIRNPSDSDVTYNLSTQPATSVSAFAEGPGRSNKPGFLPQDFAASIDFDEETEVVIPAGGSMNVSFAVSLPSHMEPNLVPILSGFIVIDSSRGEHFTIPYMGPAYNYSSAPVIGLRNLTEEQRTDARIPDRDPLSAPQVFANSDGADIGNRRSFSLQWPHVIIAQFSSLQPVRQFRMDIVRASTNFTPTWYGFDPSVRFGNLTETTRAENGTVGGVPVIGTVDVQNDFPPQTNYQYTWQSYPLDVTGAIGIDLGKGSYRILLRWLKYFEDEGDPNSWDSWLSGVVDITEDQIRPE